MGLQLSTDASDDVISDFTNEFYEAYELCEVKLVELENNPENAELVNLLFRAIHSIKGNLSFVGLQPLIPLLQSVEDLLSKVREGTLVFSAGLSDVILLSMDSVKSVVDEISGRGASPLTSALIEEIRTLIRGIISAQPNELQQAIKSTINALAPETIVAPTITPTKDEKTTLPTPSEEKNILKVLARYKIPVTEDLKLMIDLVKPFEERSPYWVGRSARLLLITLGINELSGTRIDASQLAAASLMHDFGMCFLPLEVLHKSDQYSQKDKKLIQQHPRTAHELLHKMNRWDAAAEMVYQHHEHMNGEGYPHGLFEDEISDGAKLLAIVDTFDAIMHDRAHLEKVKRPFIRAILEINRFSGTQFSLPWVELFNQFAQKLQPHNIGQH